MGARPQHTASYGRLRKLLRDWRIAAGLTQRGLAGKLKKPHSFVHRTEVGDRRIDPIEFIAWCEACGIDPAEEIAEVTSQLRRAGAKQGGGAPKRTWLDLGFDGVTAARTAERGG